MFIVLSISQLLVGEFRWGIAFWAMHIDISWGDECMIGIIIFATFNVCDFTKHREYHKIKLSAKISQFTIFGSVSNIFL